MLFSSSPPVHYLECEGEFILFSRRSIGSALEWHPSLQHGVWCPEPSGKYFGKLDSTGIMGWGSGHWVLLHSSMIGLGPFSYGATHTGSVLRHLGAQNPCLLEVPGAVPSAGNPPVASSLPANTGPSLSLAPSCPSSFPCTSHHSFTPKSYSPSLPLFLPKNLPVALPTSPVSKPRLA